jgi:hypothetical protein
VADDVNAFNAEAVTVREPLTGAETLAEFCDAQQALRRTMALVRPEHLTADGRFQQCLEGRMGDDEHDTAPRQQWL